MPLPPQLQAKYLARFDELVSEGEAICSSILKKPGRVYYRDLDTGEERRRPEVDIVDWPRHVAWRTNSVALLSQIVPSRNEVLWQSVKIFSQLPDGKGNLEWGIATLRAIRSDFAAGFLEDVSVKIEAEIAADYMGQAEGLLQEGQPGKYDHVPAAVLAGAILEKALRTLCGQQQPPISTIKPNGEPKTLNPLIDELKKANLFNEAKAKQLRAWADIRNLAAHGEFDHFTRGDVEQMIPGINNFLADYLK